MLQLQHYSKKFSVDKQIKLFEWQVWQCRWDL